MISYNSVHNDPVMSAAKKALETGKAHHILIWIPEASENMLKNLLEKACCECRIQRMDMIISLTGISQQSDASIPYVTAPVI